MFALLNLSIIITVILKKKKILSSKRIYESKNINMIEIIITNSINND